MKVTLPECKAAGVAPGDPLYYWDTSQQDTKIKGRCCKSQKIVIDIYFSQYLKQIFLQNEIISWNVAGRRPF